MHTTTIELGALCLLVLGLSIAGIINQRGERRLPAGLPTTIALACVSLVGLVLVVFGEIDLAHRDDAMRAQLATAHIEMVSADDDLVNVKTGDCSAVFQIKQDANPGAWPIIPGTGKVIDGCESKDLDRLFIRP